MSNSMPFWANLIFLPFHRLYVILSCVEKESFKDDLKLVEACINRDITAWSSFIRKYSNLIFISIKNRLKKYGFTPPVQDMEDIRQNLLSSIWEGRKLDGVKNRKDISYWLSIVSGNMAIEYMRRKRRLEPGEMVSLNKEIDEKRLSYFIRSAELNPLDRLVKDEVGQRIEFAIDSLPAKERLVAKLNILYDKKYREIADILNLPEGTVSSYMKRAKGKLKEALKDFR